MFSSEHRNKYVERPGLVVAEYHCNQVNNLNVNITTKFAVKCLKITYVKPLVMSSAEPEQEGGRERLLTAGIFKSGKS